MTLRIDAVSTGSAQTERVVEHFKRLSPRKRYAILEAAGLAKFLVRKKKPAKAKRKPRRD